MAYRKVCLQVYELYLCKAHGYRGVCLKIAVSLLYKTLFARRNRRAYINMRCAKVNSLRGILTETITNYSQRTHTNPR